ncbi:MAG: hypothetical protein JAY74_27320, partial [Candidatus Thiodiazotropha taylori]|nr:hypothetical protein [Candidatus Thiodiazotropha taylori]
MITCEINREPQSGRMPAPSLVRGTKSSTPHLEPWEIDCINDLAADAAADLEPLDEYFFSDSGTSKIIDQWTDKEIDLSTVGQTLRISCEAW